jgi:chemotaxis signal transduction protein
MASKQDAWLLERGTRRVAVAPLELAAVIYRPRLHALPLTPLGFPGFALWQGAVVPVVDLELLARMGQGGGPTNREAEFLGVLRYPRQDANPIAFGALLLDRPPLPVTVEDDQAAPFPDPFGLWSGISWSCFRHAGDAVPILNLVDLFAGRVRPIL